MVAKNLSVRGLYAFLTRDDSEARAIRKAIGFPHGQIPTRRTFDRRLRNWKPSAQAYLRQALDWFIAGKYLGISRLALDRRMFRSLGKLWHSKDKKRNHIPQGLRNIDRTASWQKSYYRGWIYGHGLDVLVSTTELVVPIAATASSLDQHENKTAQTLLDQVPSVRKGAIGADSAYADRKLDQLAHQGGRSLQAAAKRGKQPKSKTYHRRKVTVEPFFERLALAFPHIRDKLPVKEESRVAGYLLTTVFVYQCAVILNLLTKQSPLQVTHLLHFL